MIRPSRAPLLVRIRCASAAALVSLSSCAGAPPVTDGKHDTTPPDSSSGHCDAKSFDGTNLQARVSPYVVQLRAGMVRGTAFILEAGPSTMLFATNYHVIAEGDQFTALIPARDKPVELGGLEVVKIDAKNDLALLRSPAIGTIHGGLRLSTSPVALAQKVAALGYPEVGGSEKPTLTFETGDISAAARDIGNRSFIQTNANVNPGNSGGPLVDACGSVVGIIVATSRSTERVALAIPARSLAALHTSYARTPDPAEIAVAAQLNDLLRFLQLDSPEEAAAIFSRKFMREVMMPRFALEIERAAAKESVYAALLKGKGLDYDNAPLEDRTAFLMKVLKRREFRAWLVMNLVATGAYGRYEAMSKFLAFELAEQFGDLEELSVASISQSTPDTARALARLTAHSHTSSWRFELEREWGAWRISEIDCTQGCTPSQ